jgi:hypothetical protein
VISGLMPFASAMRCLLLYILATPWMGCPVLLGKTMTLSGKGHIVRTT